MTITCEKARDLLERFHDEELDARERHAVTAHLEVCAHCSQELDKLVQVSGALKSQYGSVAASEDFSGMWERIDAQIGAAAPEAAPWWRRLGDIFALPKPVWATIGAAAAAIALLLAYLPGTQEPAVAANDCIIDTVEAEDGSVMVYETDETKMKIIWVMELNGDAQPEKGVTS
jgi:anti-sigma factor RsiW